MKKERTTKWFYWFTLAVAIIAVYKIIDSIFNVSTGVEKISSILIPFFVGIIIAYLFYIPCRKLEKLYNKSKLKLIKKKSRTLSILTVYLLAIVLIVVLINTLIPVLTNSIKDLASNLPEYYKNIINYFNNLPEKSIIKKENVKDIVNSLQKVDITKLVNIENIFEYIKGAVGLAGTIFNIFVTIIMSVYILRERSEILNFMKKVVSAIFKKETSEAINSYFIKANDIFFKFISSQILDGIIVGIVVSIALKILNVKYFALLGFFIGLSNIIPYFGAIIGVTISAIITLFTGGLSKVIWMCVIAIIIQQIDANIINPKIIGNALKLSPILVIFGVTLIGAYYGVLGMFLAVPIVALLKIIINDYLDYKIKNKQEIEGEEEC